MKIEFSLQIREIFVQKYSQIWRILKYFCHNQHRFYNVNIIYDLRIQYVLRQNPTSLISQTHNNDKNWVLQYATEYGILNVGKDSCYVCDDALF